MVKSARTVLLVAGVGDVKEYQHSLQQDDKSEYRFLSASSDEQILALCQTDRIDIIILESDRPESSGLEVLKWLKTQMGQSCPPIIAIGIDDAEIAVLFLKAGAADYLIKERITPDKLCNSLQGAMEQSTSEAIANSTSQTQQRSERQIESGFNFQAIENLPVGAVFVVDRDLRYLLAEGEALYTAGFKPEDLVGRTIFEALPPELTSKYEELYRQVLAGKTFSWEHNAHGSTYISRGTPLSDSQGEIYAVLAVSYDISERKQAEAVLKADLEATQLLHDLSTRLVTENNIQVLYDEIVATAIALTKADAGTIQILDEETEDLLLLATQGFERTMTEHFYRVNANSQTPCGIALAEGDRTFIDFDVPASEDPDGSLRMHLEAGFYSSQSTPLISRSGKPIGMFSTHWCKHHRPTERELQFLDLLARQAADEIERWQIKTALHESETKFRLLVTAGSDLIYKMSADWHEMYSLEGKNFLVSTKHSSQTWIETYIPKQERSLVWATIQESIRTKSQFELEHRVIQQNGKIGWTFSRAIPMLNEQGEIIEWFGAASNITERKQAEAALRELEIQRVREQAEREKERDRAENLAELDRAKTIFFSNISHEFRTPLTLLLAPLEDALKDLNYPLPEPQRERLQLAHCNSLRLLKLVNTLLDFSRVEAGRLQANYEPTDLATYTAELASTFRSAIEDGGLEFVVDCPPLPKLVYIDRSMWEKIVLNLLSNAFKFTQEGTIVVSLQATPEDRVQLIVRDTGIGIDVEELPHVFDRFYQIQGRQGRSSEGSGIGLSLVRELVKLQGGEIEVSSEVDRGTTFTVTIPLGKEHLSGNPLQQNETKSPTDIPTPTSTARTANSIVAEAQRWLPQEEITLSSELPTTNSKRGRIPIVDDNADLQNYLQKLLSPDYQVATANNGLAALNKIREAVEENDSSNRYDLILADIMMPEMDGFELLRSLRADPNTQEIPIILLSARAGEESRVEGLAAGADDYLIKPFSPRELLARVNSHLNLVQMRREAIHRERAMQEMHEQNKILEYRVRERTARLKAINQELEAFSYSVSHDLQTPLHYISSFAKKLQAKLNSKLDPTNKRYFKIVVQSAEQSQQMVHSLLEFSRLGQAPLRLVRVPMGILVQLVQQQLELEIEERVVHWQIEPLPEVLGDPTLLRLVLQNLMSNAIKYTSDRTEAEITIGSSKSNGEIVFFVKDNGVGFDMEYHDRLFELFQRLHSQEQFAGTGVGLAQVKRIVHRHGGRVWAEGEVGRGATFYFSVGSE
ncbi:ATP-binding protein [Myxosarcina sp. GI1]|uniref:ATP-binding protein n=1 Tax=Myxosarcina sp. GI1 TaxID=1541065 RepID=UPI00068F22E8|nr:ATP-binding protein [Myxosarcina sp. GI1]